MHASWNDPEEIRGNDDVGEGRIINCQSKVLVCVRERGKPRHVPTELRAGARGLSNRAGTARHCAEVNTDPGCRCRVR